MTQEEYNGGNLHVDDWLDQSTFAVSPTEVAARYFLEQFRWPAWKKLLYADLIPKTPVYALYNGEWYQLTGASRMGDIWLRSKDQPNATYTVRVFVQNITRWSLDAEVWK